MKKLSEMNVGLVLSGGGAKGAYQIGMLRALEELGISRQISVISGTSIGAFNALAYAVGGTEKMRDIMTHFFACYERGMDNDEATLARAKENVLAGRTGMEEFISDPAYRCSDSAPLAEYMRASLPDALLADYKLRVLACAYSLEDACPQYFTLNGLPGEAQRQLVLASGSLAGIEKLAVVLGTEGDGLAADTIARCDYTVRIPMSHGVDSLNVAAASAVAFYQLGTLAK